MDDAGVVPRGVEVRDAPARIRSWGRSSCRRTACCVGQGYHERAGEAHAEVHALSEAGDRARGATLYCTLEPCAHQGRTGPCAARIVEAGIRRVVAAVQDPNPLVRGRGFAYLRAHGLDVDVGLGAAESTALNQAFFTLMNEERPFVILKAATSADGFIAASPDRPTRTDLDARESPCASPPGHG